MADLTLHLAQLPRRPASEDTFTRDLLSAIHPNNPYAKDRDLKLPHLELALLPKDNRRVSDADCQSQDALQIYSAAKAEVLNKTSKDSSGVQLVFEALFKQLDHVYHAESAQEFTIGKLRKMCREIEHNQEMSSSLTPQELNVVRRRLRHVEPRICMKSKTHLSLLDERFKIVCLSRATCDNHTSMAFLTFLNHEAAREFVSCFDRKLVMGGRKIKISFAAQESLVGGYLHSGKRGVDALLSKKIQKKSGPNPEADADKRLKRQMRRLRHKLKHKGLEESAIHDIVHKAVQDRIASSTISTSKQSKTKTKSPEPHDNKNKKTATEVSMNPPNKVLLVQNLPSGVQSDDISSIFAADGFIEVRLVSVRNLAFVEYATISHASNVVSKLGPLYEWGGSKISIGFAK
ncbi:LAFA_0G10924g1_1 [Lachancea sp. 'fantastica']|nr:LAFA_0G10924g1_1 [Lachancea sp. 'fantastica']